jgi:hypothetical protein
MCNICDYCDENGRVVPFVGEAYVCPKCNGTKVLPIAETVKNSIGMDIPVPQDAAVDGQTDIRWLDGVLRGEILTPEQIEARHQRPTHWHQAPAADANFQPKFEIQDETSIIKGHVISGHSGGFLVGINWAKDGGKIYADTETQPLPVQSLDEKYQAEDRVHRPNIQHISPKQAQMMADAANRKKPSVWYDSALGEAHIPQSEVDFEKSLNGDIWVRIFKRPEAIVHNRIIRSVKDALEAGTLSDDIGYHISLLPLSQQAAALERGICGQYPPIDEKKIFSSPSRQIGKSSAWQRYRENFMAQWQGAEAGQNYTDALAYNRAVDPLAVKKFRDEYQGQFTRDEKTAMFGAMYGKVSSQERQFQSALADAPTLGEIIGLLRVTEARLSSDAEYFLAAHGGNEDQTKMLGKVRTARVKLQALENSMLGRIHQNQRLVALAKPRDIVPDMLGRYNSEMDVAKSVQNYLNLRRMNEQAKDPTNVEPMSVEITMQHEFPKRGDLSEMKPVIVDIKVDDASVLNALKMKRMICEQLRQGTVSSMERVKDELDEEHAKGTGPMPPKELL